jgi:hypothetical protein
MRGNWATLSPVLMQCICDVLRNLTLTCESWREQLVGPASWRLSFAGTALANKGENVARKEPIT